MMTKRVFINKIQKKPNEFFFKQLKKYFVYSSIINKLEHFYFLKYVYLKLVT